MKRIWFVLLAVVCFAGYSLKHGMYAHAALSHAPLLAQGVTSDDSKADPAAADEKKQGDKTAIPAAEKSDNAAEQQKIDPGIEEKGDPDREKAERDRIEKERLVKERTDRDNLEREKLERDRRAKEQTEQSRAKKIKLSIVDLSTKEYLALFVGYGGYFPVADYGNQYKPANMVSGTVGVYVINFVGLSPELHIRYAGMENKKDLLRYNSSMSLLQFFPGIIYRYHFQLPRNTLTLYGRIWDGVSRVAYSSRNPYFPLFKENIVENINVFGISAGCYYDVWKGLLVGIDFNYSIVFTAGKPMQGVSLMLNVGWRIL